MSHRFSRSIKLVLLLCLFLIKKQGSAQFERFRNYNIKDGLPGSETYGVMQDSKGYMWVIGDMGVSRFNGYGFKNYSIEDGLSDNTLFGILEDKKHRVWFRSLSGRLSYFSNDSIHSLAGNDTLEQLCKRSINTSMFVDSGDTVWLGFNRSDIIKISPPWKNNCFEKVKMPGGKYICDLGEGRIYGGSSPQGKTIITIYDRWCERIFELDPDIIKADSKESRFFVTKLSDGTFLASIDTYILNFNKAGVISKKEEKQLVIYLLQDSDGSIIVGTYDGASVLSGYKHSKRRKIEQLSGKVITGMALDKEDDLWFTTEGNGLFCQEQRNFKYYTPENGISESKISCIEACGKSIMVGHLNGTINILNGDSITSFSVNGNMNSPILKARINSIFNSADNVYVASITNAYSFDGKSLKFIPEIKSLGIKALGKSTNNTLWAISYSRIIKFGLPRFKVLLEVAPEKRVDNIFEDSKGKLWLCTRSGVQVYDGNSIKDLEMNPEFSKYRPIDISEDIHKNIWIVTRGGGVIIKNGKKYMQITEKLGLAGNMCKSICMDSNVVWIGTNKGLSKIYITAFGFSKIENLFAKNGLLTNEIISIIKYDHKICLAHNTGITIFDPRSIETYTYSPPVYILSTLVNDSLLPLSNLGKLEYFQNYITLNYLGLSYKNAGNIEYKYKMVGIDSNWIHTNYTSVKYRTVPPGDYAFYVYAKGNDGSWSKEPAFVKLTILPAWWQTTFFRCCAFILGAALIIFAFKYRLKKVNLRDSEKTALQNRIAETELKALRAQMNPHFIYNAINSVQYFITGNDPESSQKYLAKFARLIRYVVDNSKPASIPLKTEIEALYLYLQLESLRFENRFEYSINVDENLDTSYTQIPSMLIQPYVENAIWHGIMHKDGKGRIGISMRMEAGVLKCVIEDDGIGRKRSQEIKQNNNANSYKSLGMSITRERLEIINQINNITLSVNVIDLVNEQGNGTGTRIELNIPLK